MKASVAKVLDSFKRLRTRNKVIMSVILASVLIGPFLGSAEDVPAEEPVIETVVEETTTTTTPPETTTTTEADEGTELEALTMCQQFVRESLVSPGTADFPVLDRPIIVETVEGTWRVRSYVDAENAYGATLRADWFCEVSYQGDDMWLLENIEIIER